jgi:hypothetical protein
MRAAIFGASAGRGGTRRGAGATGAADATLTTVVTLSLFSAAFNWPGRTWVLPGSDFSATGFSACTRRNFVCPAGRPGIGFSAAATG